MMQILQPPEWARPRGYANGIAARGTLVFTSGQLGWDAEEKLVGPGYAEQAIQILKNIVAVLAEAGARPEHLVRLTWYVSDRDAYFAEAREVGRAYRELIGHFPVMSAFQVASLMVPGAKVQIEATAVIPD
ncbi:MULTISPECIES: RidA family protein [Chromobacterium]|uniref:RidA family protein n=2 Tax=Chromobacterium TaxID=535 RepID=A0AAD0RLM8_9NEIS|nr:MULTISPECIES: RidA family protein [Chromobacterium]AXT44735.1 RidA family protein [Chromobacterium rhizoryzae]MCP1291126.1 RidA family protein [Chromobacterium sp. S0633]MDH0342216.1 RidA family protein [Chromobacterium haemolyticum]NHR05133.1 RidA family protein [Chromobacterium haemolyticum]OQS33473.1 enamine deaminase RidA [Chromobacterium haemolyticum]